MFEELKDLIANFDTQETTEEKPKLGGKLSKKKRGRTMPDFAL